MRLGARLLALTVLFCAAGGAAAYWAYWEARQPFKDYDGEAVFVTISPGQSGVSIARTLQEGGIIKDSRLFIAALWLRRETGRLQAGEYRFEGPASLLRVVDRLVGGDVFYLAVTIPEGLTLVETADLLNKKGLGDANEFRDVFSRGDLIASLDSRAQNLEGYLFPETYRFARNPAPEDVASALVSRFSSIFDDTRRGRAKELGLDVRQVVTFASLVEKETGQGDERPLVASVFWNRLRRRIPLQSDPTLIYELKRQGQFDGDLRRDDLKMETPYNTYLRAGLPPGPIASPGREAIDAVLYAADTKYLYFVSKNNGSHHFSASFEEHNVAVRKYQIDYFRTQRPE